jgi:hypothetical protein
VSNGLRPTKRRSNTIGFIVGGISPRGSVGAAGGWLQGGGHSVMSPNYGLGMQDSPLESMTRSHDGFVGVDNVLEFTIVTADGIISSPTRTINQDLFWALRGWRRRHLGRRHFGLLQNPPLHPFDWCFARFSSTNPDSTRKLLAEIIRLTPELVEQGLRWIWQRNYRRVSIFRPITQRHNGTDQCHFSFPCSNLRIPNQVSRLKTPHSVPGFLELL